LKYLRDMPQKWYQSRTIQASIVIGVFTLLAAILTTPLWLRESTSSPDKEKEEVKTKIVLNPVSIEIKPNISKQKIEPFLVAIRDSRKLRELIPLESGKSIAKTPHGTFFFLFGPFLAPYIGLSEGYFTKVLGSSIVSRTRDLPYDDFEIHYVSEKQIFLLAFVSSEAASSIS